MHIAGLTGGAKMALPAFLIFFKIFVLPLHYGMAKITILKERLFGLGNSQGNHGEDVKELYYYLDNIPTHYYMEYLYKYPQQEFPYEELLKENRKRSKDAT